MKRKLLKLKRLKPLKKRERPFEYDLRDELKRRHIMFVKCKPTLTGFPDRLAIGLGTTRLVELKREDEDLQDDQRIRIREIEEHGVKVLIINGPNVRRAANHVEAALKGWA